MTFDDFIAFYEKKVPFNALLKMKVLSHERGRCQILLPFSEQLIGDPMRPALHGGVLATLADAAGGLAVFTEVNWRSDQVCTIDLRVDYLRRGKPEDLICDAHVIRAGNRVGVTTMHIHHGDPDYIVAKARAVYNVVRNEAS